MTGFPFFGFIDEVRLWSVARSASDIQKNLFQELPDTEPGLVSLPPTARPLALIENATDEATVPWT